MLMFVLIATDAGARLTASMHIKCGSLDPNSPPLFELIQLQGVTRTFDAGVTLSPPPTIQLMLLCAFVPENTGFSDVTTNMCLCCTVRLRNTHLIRELAHSSDLKREFVSRHSLEWKFLFLDHRFASINNTLASQHAVTCSSCVA